MHCWEAFSLSQSVLRVGSQGVVWIWDRRPAPATPPTPSAIPERGEEVCRLGDTATTGGRAPGLNVVPTPAAVAVTADMGAITVVRPLCATAAGGGKAGMELGVTTGDYRGPRGNRVGQSRQQRVSAAMSGDA